MTDIIKKIGKKQINDLMIDLSEQIKVNEIANGREIVILCDKEYEDSYTIAISILKDAKQKNVGKDNISVYVNGE